MAAPQDVKLFPTGKSHERSEKEEKAILFVHKREVGLSLTYFPYILNLNSFITF